MFYGSDYSADGDKNLISGPHTLNSLRDLNKIHFSMPERNISTFFDRGHTENTKTYVHEIINVCYILRSLVPVKEGKSDGRKTGSQRSQLLEAERIADEVRREYKTTPKASFQLKAEKLYERRTAELETFFGKLDMH